MVSRLIVGNLSQSLSLKCQDESITHREVNLFLIHFDKRELTSKNSFREEQTLSGNLMGELWWS